MHSITELPAWERLFKKIVWKQIGNLEGKKILDFGSGEGITANYFANRNDVTAIEPSKEMLSNNRWTSFYLYLIGLPSSNHAISFSTCQNVFPSKGVASRNCFLIKSKLLPCISKTRS